MKSKQEKKPLKERFREVFFKTLFKPEFVVKGIREYFPPYQLHTTARPRVGVVQDFDQAARIDAMFKRASVELPASPGWGKYSHGKQGSPANYTCITNVTVSVTFADGFKESVLSVDSEDVGIDIDSYNKTYRIVIDE